MCPNEGGCRTELSNVQATLNSGGSQRGRVFINMREYGLQKAMEGVTTVEEVVSVTTAEIRMVEAAHEAGRVMAEGVKVDRMAIERLANSQD